MNDGNPLEDLREFAKTSMDRHETMQAAGRRDAANNKNAEIKRTFVELAPPKGFTDTPQKRDVNTDIGIGTTGSVVSSGAFYATFTDEDGDIFLQGGTINGEDIPTSTLKLYDLSSTTWQGTPDQHLYVPLTGDFVVADGVAFPGFVVSSAGAPSIGAIPTNTFPAVTGTTTASSGVCNVSLGVFVVGGFMPSGIGNRVVQLCIIPPYFGNV